MTIDRIMSASPAFGIGLLFRVLLMVAMVLPMLAITPTQGNAQERIQPALLAMIAEHPDRQVNIIVQKTSHDARVEDAVAHLGGTITSDLHIINAFGATLPARSVQELAGVDGVRWISLDAPVNKSAGSPSTTFTTWANDVGSLSATTASISSNFNNTALHAGNYIWFNSVARLSGSQGRRVTVYVDGATVEFSANGASYNLSLPGAMLVIDPNVSTATSTYDTVNGNWVTTVPSSLEGDDIFMTGLAYKLPNDLPGGINPVSWSARFATDSVGVSLTQWKWSAAVYSSLPTDANSLGIKPCHNGSTSQYHNNDDAGTPENYKLWVQPGARGGGGSNYTGNFTPHQPVSPAIVFSNLPNILDASVGPNSTFGYGSNTTVAFAGFEAEKTPGNSITKVEVALSTYVQAPLGGDLKLRVSVDGVYGTDVTVDRRTFDPYVGASNATALYVDVTGSRLWQWADFDKDVQLVVDQSQLLSSDRVYYDAVGLRITSGAGDDNSAVVNQTSGQGSPVDTSVLANVFNKAIRATDTWNGTGGSLMGQGVTVAVVDSGIARTRDLKGAVVGAANFSPGMHNSNDGYGHGTFVAGLIAGSGKSSAGMYMGVAPRAGLVNVRVSDDQGMTSESSVVSGLQWVYDNRTRYNIRVVNISLNSSMMQSYLTSPLCAAVEVLWFNRVVVVVSAGNSGTANLYPPANDPFVITVGATDDRGTPGLGDDVVASYSAYGFSETGGVKPDLVAPGTNIISLLPGNSRTTISQQHPANRVNAQYFRMSGTSMAAPMVSGAVALLLQDEPSLNPDQVKFRLKATAVKTLGWLRYDPLRAGAGYLDVYAAVTGNTSLTENSGVPASQLLWDGLDLAQWGSVNWDSVNWSSVNWSSVDWSTVNWSSVNWSSDTWNP
jgi:serine protease AprX